MSRRANSASGANSKATAPDSIAITTPIIKENTSPISAANSTRSPKYIGSDSAEGNDSNAAPNRSVIWKITTPPAQDATPEITQLTTQLIDDSSRFSIALVKGVAIRQVEAIVPMGTSQLT